MTRKTPATGPRATPVPESQRIDSLDVLRGFALLGILTMNIGAFAMPAATYFNPTVYGDLTGLNGWVWGLTHMFADLKFMAIFSMLFGAGVVLMAERCKTSGRPSAGLHYRRMGWLILFGLLHAHLLWYADILFWFGACGLLVYLFRNVSPRWLVVWGLLLLAIASGILLAAGLTLEQWPREAIEATNADLDPPAAALAEEIRAYRGSWLEQMEMRIPKALEMETSTFLSWAFWRVSGLMLLGMALFKSGVFSAQRTRAFYFAWICAALVVGLPIIGYGMQRNFATDWESPAFFFLGSQYNYWASLLVAMGWVGVVMLLCQKEGLQRLTRPLAAVGRMAFSNYILQTVLCTTLFYGHGLGLFGHVDRTAQAAVVVGVWALQLIVSPIWLRHFLFGPLEWVWRTLVYLRPQPFRRRVAESSGGTDRAR